MPHTVGIDRKTDLRNQFDHIECAGMLYMKCNGKLKLYMGTYDLYDLNDAGNIPLKHQSFY